MKISFYRTMLLIGFVVWVLETIYFGFNNNAQSDIEKLLDTVSMMFIVFGFLGDIVTNIHINKYYSKENEYNVNNGEFNFTGKVTIKNNHEHP